MGQKATKKIVAMIRTEGGTGQGDEEAAVDVTCEGS